jgi:hypothetical protein
LVLYAVNFAGIVQVNEGPMRENEFAQDELEGHIDRVAEVLARLTEGNFSIGAGIVSGELEITVYVEAQDLRTSIDLAWALVMAAYKEALGADVSGIQPISAEADRRLVNA